MLAGLPPFHSNGEYLTFRKVEKLEFEFPEGFHPAGRALIGSLLVRNPSDRLGANQNKAEIQEHSFFEGIQWDHLSKQKSPDILPYHMKLGPESEYAGIWLKFTFFKVLCKK